MKIKCYTPFCAWNVPELDHKETFFFVGHYLGKFDVASQAPSFSKIILTRSK
jgi:hypothetical protein